MSANERTDVVVVGLGPGGEYVAGTLAEAGLGVVGIESELVGGECPYWGCVPSKMMIRAGNLLAEVGRASALAGEAVATPDWARVAGRIRDEATDDWNDKVAADRFTAKGGRLVLGTGRLAGPRRVTIGDRTFEARRGVVPATGTRPRIPPVPGDTVRLDPAAGVVPTDRRMQAGEGLWAVGDMTGRVAFTHVSMYQAEIAVREILGQPGPAADYRALPRVTFTDLEIGAVGLTERQAREKALRLRTSVVTVAASTRGWIHGPGNEGFIKLLEDADRGVLIGATSAGPMGGGVPYGLNVAVHAEVSVDRLRHMIYTYPTFHRTIEAALGALR
ncbi:NAD(P)/FAD-dependent oxidoreductase [Streptomyces adustus]|uniref:NAD(P)/FAD-dependent oxidoreductase n=1 Tax=Streptomyces adustus TaxID=1609272 RepID=A0A5N8V7M7_9ACTN|nr:FAD-dependent oxidoreductase [Streptomyces adustus]MPY31270.1 NAD(P)/FAD-dependent oxidoreductase [Streptomyces adustus]